MPNAKLRQAASFQGISDITWGSSGISIEVDSNEYDSLTVAPYASVGAVKYPIPHRLAGSTEYASYLYLACPDLVVRPSLASGHSFTWADLGGPGVLYSLRQAPVLTPIALANLYSWRLLRQQGQLWAGDGVRNFVAESGESSNPAAIDGLEIQFINLSTRPLEVHLLYGLVLP